MFILILLGLNCLYAEEAGLYGNGAKPSACLQLYCHKQGALLYPISCAYKFYLFIPEKQLHRYAQKIEIFA